MANAHVIQPPTKSTYGAVELKEFIRRNTVRGFIFTLILLVFLLLLHFLVSSLSEKEAKVIHRPPVSSLTLNTPPPSMDETQTDVEDLAPPPPPTEVVVSGPAARAGTPVGVPDAELDADLKEFADMDVLDKATSVGGDGDIPDEALTLPSGDEVEVAKVEDVKQEEIPPPDQFIPVEVQPTTDMTALKKSIEYPEMARKAGIEGKVIIRVFVDKSGKPKKPEVLKSDSQMLNEAALKAVMNAPWSPAIQNDKPVGCWVTVPISFTLSH